VRPSAEERRAYRRAESRLRESILVRDGLPGHTYPRHREDLETMKAYHSSYGIPAAGLWARVRRILGGKGGGE
jgi:hypothetical protein